MGWCVAWYGHDISVREGCARPGLRMLGVNPCSALSMNHVTGPALVPLSAHIACMRTVFAAGGSRRGRSTHCMSSLACIWCKRAYTPYST